MEIEEGKRNNNIFSLQCSRIDPNQRPVAYCMGVKYGTTEDWDFLWKQYYDSNSATEQTVILEALGCTQNTVLLEK